MSNLVLEAPARGAAPARTKLERTRELVAALSAPRCYDHPAYDIRVVETHISFVVLAGAFAYKIKKPVRFPFVDYSTLQARRVYCNDEVRLNARTAGGLYLGVVPITGSVTHPTVGGDGHPIEYAVRMLRFADSARLEAIAQAGALGKEDVDALSAAIARLHAGAARDAPALSCGSPRTVLAAALENLRTIRDAGGAELAGAALERLERWTLAEHERLHGFMQKRQRTGRVRECHGDLHLGNVVRIDGSPVLFDCIEFNASLRWIDVMNDVAFTAMDLHHYGRPDLAARLVDRYLERTGDYAGLAVLPFYLVYRALVRAKVAIIHATQAGASAACVDRERAAFAAHVALAGRLSQRAPCGLVLMHGVSGSGKSATANVLVERLGGVRLRSDIVRKAAQGLAPLARAFAGVGEGLYAPTSTQRTYEALELRARQVLRAGYSAIVDATFLRRELRARFAALAREEGVSLTIVACTALEALLRERIAARAVSGADPSDATLPVLEHQLATAEPLAPDEAQASFTCDTAAPDSARIVAEWVAAGIATPARR